MRKRVIFALLSVVILFFLFFMPAPEGLSVEGKNCIAIVLFVFCLWIGNSVPKSIAAVLGMLLLIWLGVESSLSDVFKNFISSVLFFMTAAFGLAAAVKKTSIPQRVIAFTLRYFGRSSRLFILATMVASGVISSVMSDLAACAIVSALVMAAIATRETFKTRYSNLYKCLLIGIPIGSLAGGITTPIGSSSNITIMQLLHDVTGGTVGLVDWIVYGIPVAIVAVVLSWIALTLCHKPEVMDSDDRIKLIDEFSVKEPLAAIDIKVIILLIVLFVGWCFGSCVGIESTVVALIGLILLFVPGLDVLTFKEFEQEVPLDLVVMLGGLMSLSSTLLHTNAINWLVSGLVSSPGLDTPFAVLLICSVIIMLVRTFLPSGPPVAVMLTPSFLVMAVAVGLPPICLIIAISAWCQITYIIPAIDALYLITYSTGEYSIADVAKFGIPLTIVLLFVVTALLLGIGLI